MKGSRRSDRCPGRKLFVPIDRVAGVSGFISTPNYSAVIKLFESRLLQARSREDPNQRAAKT